MAKRITDIQNVPSPGPLRSAYRFRLTCGDSGTLLTSDRDLAAVRAGLFERYGDRLMEVIKHED